jgi:RND superfamily putative drug exporter
VAAAWLTRSIAGLRDVRAVQTAGSRGNDSLLQVDHAGESVDAAARGVVDAIRALDPPAGSTVLVGGYSAEQVDLRASIAAGLWKLALLVVGVTFVLLFWAFGFVLPVKAIAMNALAVGASFGVVVLVFQHGYPSGLLHFTSTGTVELTQPILVLAILFGLSTDYEVSLLSRIREEWDATGDNTEAVARGLQRTGPIITSAAALIPVVIAAFSTSQITFVKRGRGRDGSGRAGRRHDRAGPAGAGHDAAARAVELVGAAAGPRLVGAAPPTGRGLRWQSSEG